LLLVGRSKTRGKKAVEEVLRLRKARDLLHEKIEHLENIIIDGNPDRDVVLDAENRHEATRARLAQVNATIQRRESALGVEGRGKLRKLINSPFISARMNALALKIRLRDKLRARKFELDRLERSFRQQVNGEFEFHIIVFYALRPHTNY
jgi:hypothetical protein